MSNNIEGKVVVITGTSSGLGEATARLLSSEGASIPGDRHRPRSPTGLVSAAREA
jgi:NAD(P)-dependent dehydrogenase (short-subunit alcohol dehydrogenase family)